MFGLVVLAAFVYLVVWTIVQSSNEKKAAMWKQRFTTFALQPIVMKVTDDARYVWRAAKITFEVRKYRKQIDSA